MVDEAYQLLPEKFKNGKNCPQYIVKREIEN